VEVVRYKEGFDQARVEDDLEQLFRCAGSNVVCLRLGVLAPRFGRLGLAFKQGKRPERSTELQQLALISG